MVDPSGRELARPDDPHARAWGVEAPLLGVVVDHRGDRVGFHAGEVHQRVAFGARAIRPDPFSLRAQALEQVRELGHVLANPLAERDVDPAVAHAEGALSRESRGDAVACLARTCAAGEHANCPAVDLREMVDVEDVKGVRAEQLAHRLKPEVGEMLVVRRVELVPVDEVDHIGDFDDEDPPRSERDLDRPDELVNVVDVSEDVLRGDRHRPAVALDHLAGESGTPVFGDRGNASRGRLGGEISCGVHAEDLHAERPEARQEQAVVARDIECPIARWRARGAHGSRGELGAMVTEGLRGGAHVQVVPEHQVAIDHPRQLRQTASDAHLKGELRNRFGGRKLLFSEV